MSSLVRRFFMDWCTYFTVIKATLKMLKIRRKRRRKDIDFYFYQLL